MRLAVAAAKVPCDGHQFSAALPVSAEIEEHRRLGPQAAAELARPALRALVHGTRSILLSTSQRGLRQQRGSYFFSSATMRAPARPDRPDRRARYRHVQQQPRAAEVAQELVAEAGAFGRALDQARDMSATTKLRSGAHPHHAQVRVQRGERIVGDLRPRVDTAAISVDLPALGMPSRPTSASTLSSSFSFALLARLSPASSAAARDWCST
jgi:hypothetical protein